MLHAPLKVGDEPSRIPLVPVPVEGSVATPSWTMRLPDKSSGSTSPRFSFQSRISAASSGLMMILAPTADERRLLEHPTRR